MNGRLYDARLRRFLQPDNFVQEPYNTQNYNRYGYVLNNPLKYTDPSGELFGLSAIATAALVGALIGGASYTITALTADVPFTAGGFLKSAVMGAISGAVTNGIGSYASTVVPQLGSRIAFQALAHGTFQGMMSGVQGGNFWAGFASGAISSVVSSLWSGGMMEKGNTEWKGLGGSWGRGDLGTIAFGTVSGGAGAALTGGNFWQGAATGLTVSLLNHAVHKKQEDPLKKHAHKVKHSLEEWQERYKNMSWKEIATEAGWKDGQPLGPKDEWRYIKAPDGKVMDMRHVSIVGYGYGEGAGNTIEQLQNLVPRMRPSAFDPQDYFSNKIGAYFYQFRHSGSWSSDSWAYDFKRFIDVHYNTLFSNYKP